MKDFIDYLKAFIRMQPNHIKICISAVRDGCETDGKKEILIPVDDAVNMVSLINGYRKEE